MKIVKVLLIMLVLYALVVVAFETWLGISQPTGRTSLRIITTNEDGEVFERVLSRVDSQGHMYVSANHWPRRWYHQALERPEVEVEVELGNLQRPFLAIPVDDEEHDRLMREHGHSLAFRFLTGFPPRYFVRLAPM